MRITYIHQYFSNLELPGSTRSFELGRRLVAMGHEVNLITTYRRDDSGHSDWFETDEEGITVHWLPIPYSNTLSFTARVKAFLKFALKSSIKAAKIKADIIYTSSTPLTVVIPGMIAAWKTQAPMVFEVRDLWPDVPVALGVLKTPIIVCFAKQLEKLAYRKAVHIVALSPTMKSEIVKKGISSEKITMIPNASDLDRFSKVTNDRQHFESRYPQIRQRQFVLYAGALGFANRVSYMVDIAAQALDAFPDLCFIVFGEGRERKAIEDQAKSTGILDRTFFLFDRLPKKDMPIVFNSCSISCSFVIDNPAMWANSANKFFDTLSAGKPILINHLGWQADLITHHQCGLVIPPNDPAEAARMIGSFLSDNQRLIEAGENARRLAEDSFDRDNHAVLLEEVLTNSVDK